MAILNFQVIQTFDFRRNFHFQVRPVYSLHKILLTAVTPATSNWVARSPVCPLCLACPFYCFTLP